MLDKKSCCCAGDTKVLLACSGASNVGQITNDVARELDAAGEARFFCLTSVGGHVSGMVASVKGAGKLVVMDGCPVGCAKKTLEAAGVTSYEYLVVTELGVPKKKVSELREQDRQRVLAEARRKLRAGAFQPAGESDGCAAQGCCDA